MYSIAATAQNTETPVFFDWNEKVHRPMDAGDVIPPLMVPISTQIGNRLEVLTDGLYTGDYNGLIVYVNNSGSDSNPGTKTSPMQTINGALTYVNSLFPSSQFNGKVTIALQAGQSFIWPATFDFITYGGSLTLTMYGDPNYGDFNSALVAGTTYPYLMKDLQRPNIQLQSTVVNGQVKLGGINRNGGSISIFGVTVTLPAAPNPPAITGYGGYVDFIRNVSGGSDGQVQLVGSNINATDVTAYWGFIGVHSGSTTRLWQFGSQFLINGIQMSPANAPTAAQLAARQYFIKFFPDYAGNNQTQIWLSPTAQNSSAGSGILICNWSDTEALTVTGSKTNQQSFPFIFQAGYGLVNYLYGLNKTSSGQYLNFISSRIM